MISYTTHTKRWLNLGLVQPEDITIEDIAHSLAYQCRFNGHTKRFYSVAEHSVILSQLIEPKSEVQNLERRLCALLHDAAECYTGDITGPVRTLLNVYPEVDDAFLAPIYSAFCLPEACLGKYDFSKDDGDLCITEGFLLVGGMYWENLFYDLNRRRPDFAQKAWEILLSHREETWAKPNLMYEFFVNELRAYWKAYLIDKEPQC